MQQFYKNEYFKKSVNEVIGSLRHGIPNLILMAENTCSAMNMVEIRKLCEHKNVLIIFSPNFKAFTRACKVSGRSRDALITQYKGKLQKSKDIIAHDSISKDNIRKTADSKHRNDFFAMIPNLLKKTKLKPSIKSFKTVDYGNYKMEDVKSLIHIIRKGRISKNISPLTKNHRSNQTTYRDSTPITSFCSITTSNRGAQKFPCAVKDCFSAGKIYTENICEKTRQKSIKSILNKLTPDNFERLLDQLLLLKYPTKTSIDGLVSQIFDKAISEPTFSELYAELARRLLASSDQSSGLSLSVRATIRRYLVIKCQVEFERSIKSVSKENSNNLEYKEKQARHKALGNIQYVGHLYRHGLLTRKIIIESINSLLKQNKDPKPEDVEILCKLVSTVGHDIENPPISAYKGPEAYEDAVRQGKLEMKKLMEKLHEWQSNLKLESRIRFICQDLLDQRANLWQARQKKVIPKRIEEIHSEAFRELNSLDVKKTPVSVR
jgi:ribosomal protein L7Ae-like RNA K-turn-binding protein